MAMFTGAAMNDWDRNNLNFLVNADKRTLEQWQETASADDFAYALELLKMAQAELELEAMSVIESEENLDCTQAREVLARFRL